METIILGNYIGNELPYNDPGKVLDYYHQQYPCSNVLTLLYLKMLEENRPKEYDKVKAALLLSLYNRDRFHQFRLNILPGHFMQTRLEERGTDNETEKPKEEAQQVLPEKSADNGMVTDTSVIDKVKKLMTKSTTESSPSTIEEEMGMEKTFDAPTIHLEEDQSVVIDSLIAKFGGNPSTIKNNAIIAEPLANYSEGSLIEDEDIVSETLAIIYAEQGYSGKATKMLKKLSLIFPEKSSIFASQIEMIRNGKYNNQIN